MIYLILMCFLGWSGFFWLLYCNYTKIMPQKPQGVPALSEWDRKFMAFHEAGHAVVSYYSPEREELLQITIDPSANNFGHILTAHRQKYNESMVSLSSVISVFLAGRLSEEMFLKETTTSCIHDIKLANQIAHDMVLKYSMGKQIRFFMPSESGGDRIRNQVEEDIQEILLAAEQNAKEILEKKKELVSELAQQLLQRGTLTQEEIHKIFGENT